jgi:aminoglycoside 6'-N-acetyltransferase I
MDRADHLGQPVTGVAPATSADAAEWADMRQALWPRSDTGIHRADIDAWLVDPRGSIMLIARTDSGSAVGFAEASLRHDYVNGTSSSPVAFLEGIYVDPSLRRTGIARLLVNAVESWARKEGCSEMASDADIANIGSQQMHEAVGFAETQRVVFFRKSLS